MLPEGSTKSALLFVEGDCLEQLDCFPFTAIKRFYFERNSPTKDQHPLVKINKNDLIFYGILAFLTDT